ncbi:PaaI family thioesterase [Emticicia sp. BO119]|uniref:PaaI family thioesterase n=1 Tax=Emticicia sp. BO119 TaxID=2757768 RepID=UPI0015F0B6E6|nr:PaaI family thioesterase [Emticicia sp. BO119]MBA4852627.1 PaaI family thioesterase [Emticicia sp. BO119]
MKTDKRERTFTWTQPLEAARQALKLSGIDYLQAMNEGRIAFPPLLHTLDFKPSHLEKGKVIFSFQPQEFHYNPIGSVHGGVISAILDSAMGCTLHSILEAGTGYTTLELKVNFLKVVTTQIEELHAVGKIIHAGGRTALVEAQLIDNDNTIYAHGVSTCLILKY